MHTVSTPDDPPPIRVARGFRQRLYGVRAWPDWGTTPWGLFIPHCRAVHTLALAGTLDLVFLSRDGGIVRIVRALAPNRFAACHRAWAVLELPGGQGFTSGLSAGTPIAWFDWKIVV